MQLSRHHITLKFEELLPLRGRPRCGFKNLKNEIEKESSPLAPVTAQASSKAQAGLAHSIADLAFCHQHYPAALCPLLW